MTLSECKVFSVIDFKSGYNQVPINPKNIPKNIIITPFSPWEWCKMPFRLMISRSTFQSVVHSILGYLLSIFCYINDSLVALRWAEEHEKQLCIISNRLWKHHLTVNLKILSISHKARCAKTAEFLSAFFFLPSSHLLSSPRPPRHLEGVCHH